MRKRSQGKQLQGPRVVGMFELKPLTHARLRFAAECAKCCRVNIVEEALNAFFDNHKIIITEAQAERLYGKPTYSPRTAKRPHNPQQ